jgi:hypothetical protein
MLTCTRQALRTTEQKLIDEGLELDQQLARTNLSVGAKGQLDYNFALWVVKLTKWSTATNTKLPLRAPSLRAVIGRVYLAYLVAPPQPAGVHCT